MTDHLTGFRAEMDAKLKFRQELAEQLAEIDEYLADAARQLQEACEALIGATDIAVISSNPQANASADYGDGADLDEDLDDDEIEDSTPAAISGFTKEEINEIFIITEGEPMPVTLKNGRKVYTKTVAKVLNGDFS